MTDKIVALVLVRMGSSRLPGKPMIEIDAKPMIHHIVDRVRLAKTIDEVVICTSIDPLNDVIEYYCQINDIACFRGDELDVTSRLLVACKSHDATVGVTIFGDCPLIDPAIIEQIVEVFIQADGHYDFVGNDLKTTYPPGMEVEVFNVESLRRAADRQQDPTIREHGTLVIRNSPKHFKLLNIDAPPAFNRPDIEIEVDEAIDLQVIEQVMTHFGDEVAGLGKIIDFLDQHPKIRDVNQQVERRWKQYRRGI